MENPESRGFSPCNRALKGGTALSGPPFKRHLIRAVLHDQSELESEKGSFLIASFRSIRRCAWFGEKSTDLSAEEPGCLSDGGLTTAAVEERHFVTVVLHNQSLPGAEERIALQPWRSSIRGWANCPELRPSFCPAGLKDASRGHFGAYRAAPSPIDGLDSRGTLRGEQIQG